MTSPNKHSAGDIAPFNKPIYVSSPFLPPIGKYIDGLNKIWDSKQLTNNGPVLQQFSQELATFLDTDEICLFNNGTLALQLGLQSLRLSGDVITTPFTFVATSHALIWNNLNPVFCDIEPNYYTIDPAKVEAAITPTTTAILAVHVYGNPCDLEALADIAKRHNLKLIYDSAHAFGVSINGKSIAHYGDLSIFSFHATKLFHSIEGGMIVTADNALREEVNYLKNFGFKNQTEVVMTGTNAKMNEMQALMGTCVLEHVPELISKRENISNVYKKHLDTTPGIKLTPTHPSTVNYNYAYFTIEVITEHYGMSRDHLFEKLKSYNVYTRRYFYPLLNDLECYKDIEQTRSLNVAHGVASRVLTLPLYADLSTEDAIKICEIINALQINQ